MPDRFAHSLPGRAERHWEPLAAHLHAVGQRAALFAAAFGGQPFAEAMGRLHDIGKRSQAYQAYIRQAEGAGPSRGPDHSTAGAREAVALYGEIGRILAFGIAGHHAGLMDGEGMDARLGKSLEDYQGWEADAGTLPVLGPRQLPLKHGNGIEPRFSPAFLTRMLFSCLVDADFIETERFYAHAREEGDPQRGGALSREHLEVIRAHMARHRRSDSPVNALRSAILDHANGKAELAPGLFTLTVPTGGGKTLTSLSFAAEHALTHGLRRIVYVIPFTEAWIETPSMQSPSR